MWPIILVALGVLIFGVGITWFCIQQSKKIITSNSIAKSETVLQPSIIVRQPNENVIKSLARLYILERDQPAFEKLREQYETVAQKRFTMYLDQSYKQPGIGVERNYGGWATSIMVIVRDVFNENISFPSIDTQKYDINMPFPEEKQIEDNQIQYRYRKAKYEYLTGKEKLDKLSSRIQNDIHVNEGVIIEYVKANIQSPK